MIALSGTPQIQNLIPMEYFKTTPTATPVLGIVGGIIMSAVGYIYLSLIEKMTAKGEVSTESNEAIAVNLLVVRLDIALVALGEKYYNIALSTGISPRCFKFIVITLIPIAGVIVAIILASIGIVGIV